MRAVVLLVLVFVLIAGAAIGFFNAQPVSFNYLVGSAEIPLISLIFVELTVVTLVCVLVFAGRVLSLRGEIRGLRKRLAATEVELKNLRALPLSAPTIPAKTDI